MFPSLPTWFRGAVIALGLLFCPALPAPAQTFDRGDFSFFTTPTKWSPGGNSAATFSAGAPPGTPGGASWSIMGTGLGFEGFETHGGALTSSLAALLGDPGSLAEEIATINAAFNTWAAAAGITNLGMVADGGVKGGASQASGGHLGDIRVGATTGFAEGVLAHAFQPGTEAIFGPGGTIAGDVHINTGFTWADDANDSTSDGDFDLFTVVLHEIGHALGLGHSADADAVMFASYGGGRRNLHADDIAGIRAIYGPSSLTVVPEPGSMLLFLPALAGVVLGKRRRSGRDRT